LRTVRVPADIEGPFAAVEDLVSRYFRDRKDDPAHGTIEIFGERYVLVRAASLSVEFFGLVRELYGEGRQAEADAFAKNILFDLAHAIGKSDAHNFHQKMGLDEPIARLSAGPIHFAHAGWAFVDIFPESRPSPDESYYLVYDHPYSFESDAWLRTPGAHVPGTVCIMNAGYSSGWCEASFGVTLVSTEVLCRARGDEACRFVMGHPSRIEEHVRRYLAGRPGGERPAQPYQIPDFFARKRVEEELRQARDDLERRVAERTQELSLSNERLRREIADRQEIEKQLLQRHKLEAIGRLAGGIAHDFNNLMAVIVGNCALLGRRLGEDDDERRAFLAEIRSAGERAARLTNQLLTFGRAQVRSREALDLNRIVLDLGRMLERVIGDDVELVTRLDPALEPIEADRGQIEQVIMNLVVNARDAMPNGGTVTLSTENVLLDDARSRVIGASAGAGRYARFSVTDEGVGMDDETMAKIFDPFFTTKGGPARDGEVGTSGSGLGLSTVYAIVQQAHGAIAVESAPAKGARFDIYLPSGSATSARMQAAAVASEPMAHGETILLVEDQDQLRRALAQVLRELGYEVIDAADGVEAMRKFDEHGGAFDALVTDVVMPRMGGVPLAAALQERAPKLQVLYMSGYADDPLLSESAAFLQKPFEPDDLARKLRALLDR
jgi:signal transduction histidine kinase